MLKDTLSVQCSSYNVSQHYQKYVDGMSMELFGARVPAPVPRIVRAVMCKRMSAI